MGMTYAEYWDGDLWLTQYYCKAEIIKRKTTNYNLWMAGNYNYHAMVSIISAFGGKDKEPVEYPPEPFDIFGDETEERVERQRKREEAKQLEAARNYMRKLEIMYSGLGD